MSEPGVLKQYEEGPGLDFWVGGIRDKALNLLFEGEMMGSVALREENLSLDFWV